METNQRIVMLKTSVELEGKDENQDSKKELVHLNILPMGDYSPTAEDYGVQKIENKNQLNKLLQYIKTIDEPFFQWLEADAKNTILFVNDPMQALKTAIPDFDESVFVNLDKGILS